ncbi:MAG: exo-beta-N-acetylmuramidase NamZ domain-containing protein, partial [Gemmataceae bacterium]
LPFAGPLAAAEPSLPKLAGIAPLVQAAIQRGEVPGAVVVVVHQDQVIYSEAFGQRAKEPAAEPMTTDTIFDLASLTKPLATATMIFQLVEEGKLRLTDRVSQHWPEFGTHGKENITIEHCLLHTTGLIADNPLADYADGPAAARTKIAELKLVSPMGALFRYSDVGFIVLGFLVEKLRGQPLDAVFAERVAKPLKLTQTSFRPQALARVAPTGTRAGLSIRGIVHDPRAFALGGPAGHAGLFGPAADLARFARMLLNHGELDGTRFFSPYAVRQLTEPCPVPGGLRTRGYDADTSYSAPRGDLFPPGQSFGHTGFTGTSLWIDRPSQTIIIILTNRVHPADKGNATPLRRQIGTVVASAVSDVQPRKAAPRPVVQTGIDVLRAEQFQRLQGKRVGLVTNHTGRTVDGTSTIDALASAPGVKLVALFSPEHGIRGEKDEKVGNSTDTKTGLPIYSLYGEHRKPTPEMLRDIDTIVYDIQDIGCRFYTYISTLGLVLEAAAEAKIPVVVLDRPNPIDGLQIEGPLRDAGKDDFIAFHTIPIRHGLTIGEMAKLFVVEKKIAVQLDVVKLVGWRRRDDYSHTGLSWVNPSPNMRHLSAAILYPGVGLLETTNLSVGRGTERPFEWIGAPYLDGRAVASALNARELPGVRFIATSRTPTSSVHANKLCGGVDIVMTDAAAVRPVALGLHIAATLKEIPAWEPKNFNRLLVHQATFDALKAGADPAKTIASWDAGVRSFRSRRAAVLLYPD